MNHHVPLYLVAKSVPFSVENAGQMRRRGWSWVVPGAGRRLWIDIDGPQAFMKARAPVWAIGFDLGPLRELAAQFEFDQEAAS